MPVHIRESILAHNMASKVVTDLLHVCSVVDDDMYTKRADCSTFLHPPSFCSSSCSDSGSIVSGDSEEWSQEDMAKAIRIRDEVKQIGMYFA